MAVNRRNPSMPYRSNVHKLWALLHKTDSCGAKNCELSGCGNAHDVSNFFLLQLYLTKHTRHKLHSYIDTCRCIVASFECDAVLQFQVHMGTAQFEK